MEYQRHSSQFKEAIVKRYNQSNMSVRKFAQQEGINLSTMYSWHKQFKTSGINVSKTSSSDKLSAEEKFSIVLETATLSEIELSEYCRSRGLYPEQVKGWKQACITSNSAVPATRQKVTLERKADKKRIKKLEKELHRKDKALAEAAALLVLGKKFRCLFEGKRGQLTTLSDRRYKVKLINEATHSGARQHKACEIIGISIRTLQRWQESGCVSADKRPTAVRPAPSNKLSEQERQSIIDVCNVEEFATLPPSQIVPILADRSQYIASESSFYRVLKAANMLHHRGKAKTRNVHKKPTSYTAKKANEVWSWDISYLPTKVIGQHYYLYMMEDIYSRKIVGWEVHGNESGEQAAELLERSVWSEKCRRKNLVLHSDNGAPMKSLTMQAKMYDLGVVSSRSRPRVSNDNPYSESLFRTVKYCPRWPSEGFKSLTDAREWVKDFVDWYNNEHRHSRIKFVTPSQRHQGLDVDILAKRKALYQRKRSEHPERWSGIERNWLPEGAVELNPEQHKEAA
ncbi:IS3 family transposase [Dasania sp. GY-MA-18]|uniref:IS3 family transposase n=1 Tax=Dasania phycosphaerae TaxID=2950436 RepID=A0A9J6RQB3_9GAMM|nr:MULTISPECIES: IS3 family transposase [Dasania]MCR8923885.1 IS3 family transposase [Dasania sp. GY-MA-18]MCZ0866319.1 IS3 family transposase [Dasania phycosphaerae]MCZ0870043.1 IS3 family transposase [Dasania phycosphaerae]